jgi:hypothetical protein
VAAKKLHKTWIACGSALTARGNVKFTTEACGIARGHVEDPSGAYFTQISRSVASDS